MRVERFNKEVVGVVLSRRNLLTLLAKLDGEPEGSACTILAPAQYGPFFVKAEEDGPHYFNPTREARGEAGVMHPATEVRLHAPGVSPAMGCGFVAVPEPTD